MQYVDNDNHPHERVLESKETTDKTAKGHAKEILKSLEPRGAPKSDLVYQLYDYAASMSGAFNGAQQCLQNLLQSWQKACGHLSFPLQLLTL